MLLKSIKLYLYPLEVIGWHLLHWWMAAILSSLCARSRLDLTIYCKIIFSLLYYEIMLLFNVLMQKWACKTSTLTCPSQLLCLFTWYLLVEFASCISNEWINFVYIHIIWTIYQNIYSKFSVRSILFDRIDCNLLATIIICSMILLGAFF